MSATWTAARGLREGYQSSNWVYAALKRISDAASSVPWKVRKRKRSGEWVDVPGHALEELVERPNPFMSRQDVIERTVLHLYLAGNAILWMVRAGNVRAPVELWPINPDAIKPLPDPVDYISAYQYRGYGGATENMATRDIVHLMFADPATPYWGMSPLVALAAILDAEQEAINWWKVSIQNRCVKDGVLSFKKHLTTTQWKEIRSAFMEQHSGSDVSRGPIVIGDEVEYTPFSMTPAEVDWLATRSHMREDILGVLGVPPPLVSVLDQATYANIREARRIFWLDTVIPLLEGLRSSLNRVLIPEFGEHEKLQLTYDLSNVDALQRDLLEKAEIFQKLWSGGIPTNMLIERLELGIARVPGGDIGYVPSNHTPVLAEAVTRAPAVSTELPATSNGKTSLPTFVIQDWPLLLEKESESPAGK